MNAIGVRSLNSIFQEMDLIDLLSERHIQIRRMIETRWNEQSDIYISNTEWFIMARIYKKQPTISYVTRHVDISRQATHKFIKSMEQKGLVKISSHENNRKEKCVQLTNLGEKCYQQNVAYKEELEQRIMNQIGDEKYKLLKDILRSDWSLDVLDDERG